MDIMKHIKKFNESKTNLPKSLDIDNELSQLKIFIKEKEDIKDKHRGKKSLIDIIDSDEFQQIQDKEEIIEDKIKEKLWKTIMSYCDNGDFEGAKQFVHNSYKDVLTSGKTLLFRSIIVLQDQHAKK
jgi:hypothetical protein